MTREEWHVIARPIFAGLVGLSCSVVASKYGVNIGLEVREALITIFIGISSAGSTFLCGVLHRRKENRPSDNRVAGP